MRSILIYGIVIFFRSIRSLLETLHINTAYIFAPGFEKLRWKVGKMKAYIEFLKARKSTPAYKKFLTQHTYKISFNGLIPNLHQLPIIDKENYIKRYTIEEKCRKGKIPTEGVVIDESSGSTGMPTNWIRGKAERKANKNLLEIGLKHLLGKEPKFIINAFALGPWATGINITMSFIDTAILKSLGPDVNKIENTLCFFGATYNYVIMGYPPFLKTLIDIANIDWRAYNITFIYGGEGMSEAMRDYFITKGIKKVYGSLGASDLELNIGSENNFTIALRKLLEHNKLLASKLIKYTGALPMIFQYNPLDFVMETTLQGDLLVTLCRPHYICPKIRYNIHDRGHVVRIPELRKIFKECNIDIKSLGIPSTDFPLLFHYGRADMTVAYFGCKISPADIQEVIFRISELASITSSFTILTYEDEFINKQLVLCLELIKGKEKINIDDNYLQDKIFTTLQIINQDFRESFRMIPKGNEPKIEWYNYATGPFKDKNINIKLKYITTS